MHIRLIRHGMTAGNAVRRYVGITDEPLCPEGRAAAEQKPKDYTLDRVYVSPLKRARETAAILFPNAEQIVINDLHEMDFGVFEGRTGDEMKNDSAYRAWVENRCTGVCPGGESQEMFHARVGTAFCETVRALDSDATFVVHGGVIMSVLWQFAEPKKDFYDWVAPNLSGYEADVSIRDGAVAIEKVSAIS